MPAAGEVAVRAAEVAAEAAPVPAWVVGVQAVAVCSIVGVGAASAVS